MREDTEQERVYVLTDTNGCIYCTSGEVTQDWFSDSNVAAPFGEGVIYDFSLPEGAFVDMLSGGDLRVHWIDPIVSGGISRRVMQHFLRDEDYPSVDDLFFVEGIGPTCSGHLAKYECYMTNFMFNDNTYMPKEGSALVAVYEPDGTLIYGTDEVVGINALPETQPEDPTLYDLMGRPVANPQPGSIYIRNGKKVILR